MFCLSLKCQHRRASVGSRDRPAPCAVVLWKPPPQGVSLVCAQGLWDHEGIDSSLSWKRGLGEGQQLETEEFSLVTKTWIQA